MRYFLILTLIFYINFANAAQLANETIEIEVTTVGRDEPTMKKQAFDKALQTASERILRKYATPNQRRLIDDIIAKGNLRKFFSEVDVITSDITEKDGKKRFSGTFRFVFEIEDVQRWLTDNGLAFVEQVAKHYDIIQVPIFIEGNNIYHWFDSSIADAFLKGLKSVNNFHLSLVEPNFEVIKIELLNKYRMHQLARSLKNGVDYDGYNLVICQIQDSGSLECENHLVYEDKKIMQKINLSKSELDGGAQLISELNSIYLSSAAITEDLSPSQASDDAENGMIYLEFRYDELADLLRFQKLLTQNPYIAQYKVRESGFGSTRFLIQLRGDFTSFRDWMSENNIESLGYDEPTNTYILQLN